MDAFAALLMGGDVYLAPALLALLVRHQDWWLITIVTVLLGWTAIGWFSAWYLLFLPLTPWGQVMRLRRDLARTQVDKRLDVKPR